MRFFYLVSISILLFFTNIFSSEQILAVRLGLGYNDFIGKDLKASTKGGFTWSCGFLGAQPISDGKYYWGVETNFSQRFSSFDTTSWNENTGVYDKKAKGKFHGEYIDLAFFTGRKFLRNFFIYAGPQVSYMLSSSKNIAGKKTASDDDFSPFQAEIQAKLMYYFHESFAIDFKYSQSFLPIDSYGQLKIYGQIFNLGFLYIF